MLVTLLTGAQPLRCPCHTSQARLRKTSDTEAVVQRLAEAVRAAQAAVKEAHDETVARGGGDAREAKSDDGSGGSSEDALNKTVSLGKTLDAGEVAALVASTPSTRDVLLRRAPSSASGGMAPTDEDDSRDDPTGGDVALRAVPSVAELNGVVAGEAAMQKVRDAV